MAEVAALAVVGWFVAPAISKLVNKSISFLGTNTAKELEDLETTLLPQIQLTIQAAQHSPTYDMALGALTKWLARLKNAYFDAEAILHEVEYEQLELKVKAEDKKHLLLQFLLKLTIKKDSLLQRLKELKKVAAEAKTFRDLLPIQNTGIKDGVIVGNHSPCITSSLLTDKVFGRDGDRDQIVNFLLDKQEGSSLRKSYSVVAVTGMGGVGKTTLAQYVYNNPRVKEHFDSGVRMWLSLSRNLDITKHTKQMIECASKKECPNLDNFDALQNKLLEILSESANILVVLDDVWYEHNGAVGENEKWNNLLKPFASRGGACKIVVTSRSTLFPIALRPQKLVPLRDLACDDFISLLRCHAIDGISDPQLKNELSDIIYQIANKMSKSPLAAKVICNQLCERPDIRFWQATLENVHCLKDTMEILLWSFYRLDVQLQRCFLFCSIFPKGTLFDLHALVKYWVALDFIQPSNDNRSVEDIGIEYFEKMVANSIFHPVGKKYIMEDLFHDLAEKLSAGDNFRVTNTKREISLTVQHVYLEALNNEDLKENLSSIYKLSNLRTLILVNPFINDIRDIIHNISEKFKNLRVLDVRSRGYKTLPRVVGELKNLRLVNFGKSSIQRLPNSVLQLYHLQYLWLPSSVKTFPTDLSNLIKLRCIEMFNNDGRQVNTLPPLPYLGKLTSLQRLDEFHVSKEKGYELHQLRHLKEIGGSLRIVNLENVRDKKEAMEARLIDKPKLKSLELVWDGISGLDKEVIEALRPPANLEWLTIDGYRGSTYPTWLQEGSFIKYIKDVRFYNCHALTNLPPNFHQFLHCSRLDLQNLGALRELPTFPENLARLSIIKCPCLIFVCENELRVDENQSIIESRILRYGVGGCKDKLGPKYTRFKQRGKSSNQQQMNFNFGCSTRANKKILKLPSMLRVLILGDCCVSDKALWDCLRGVEATLEELYLSGITTLTILPPTQVLKSLQRLRVVEIKACHDLRSLGGLHAVPHLMSLLVECCRCLKLEMESGYTLLPPTLQSFIIISCRDPQAFLNNHLPCLHNDEINNCLGPWSISFRQLTNLKSLVLVNCPNLLSIWGLESCLNLEFIDFIDCPKILGLPQLPGSVQRIRIRGCTVLRERCQPNNGPDWHKIQHIQDRWIE